MESLKQCERGISLIRKRVRDFFQNKESLTESGRVFFKTKGFRLLIAEIAEILCPVWAIIPLAGKLQRGPT